MKGDRLRTSLNCGFSIPFIGFGTYSNPYDGSVTETAILNALKVEMHPMWRQKKLREACTENKIHVSAYTSLGGPGNAWGTTAVMEHPTIRTIALRHNVTPAQARTPIVALQWGVSVGASVIVKSFNEKRMEENFAALNFKLEYRDMLEIDTIEERKVIRAEIYVGRATGPYKTLEELWDNEI
ncbi:hypothetical protein MLD38_029066 [Melastoma candidum]|uniref:Uncharacterized protein n=1 Tax=Melastoma candidum TaxID=119954 RepID=A0ACB9N2Y6_9MYRT|nr:hypothetical protein MLD38_029066 [Melastoma candidum]